MKSRVSDRLNIEMKFSLRLLYLYLFSFVGLLISVIGSIQLVDLGIKTYIFPEVDVYDYSRPVKVTCPENGECVEEFSEEENKKMALEESKRNRQRQFSSSFSMIAVGIPLYLYHWNLIKKEKKD